MRIPLLYHESSKCNCMSTGTQHSPSHDFSGHSHPQLSPGQGEQELDCVFEMVTHYELSNYKLNTHKVYGMFAKIVSIVTDFQQQQYMEREKNIITNLYTI